MKDYNRRSFIRNSAFAGLGIMLLGNKKLSFAQNAEQPAGVFSLPSLAYPVNALEPHIDALTMEIHHDRHHKTYVDNLNKAVKENNITETSLEKIFSSVSTMHPAIRNNGGGHYNHTMFWEMMKPNGGGLPKGKVAEAIDGSFGSFDTFKTRFSEAAKSRFGSGWAWLIKNEKGQLEVTSTPIDLSEVKGMPLLGLDVWEHAYYLKYQNKRADYITAFWNVINWDAVAKRMS